MLELSIIYSTLKYNKYLIKFRQQYSNHGTKSSLGRGWGSVTSINNYMLDSLWQNKVYVF